LFLENKESTLAGEGRDGQKRKGEGKEEREEKAGITQFWRANGTDKDTGRNGSESR